MGKKWLQKQVALAVRSNSGDSKKRTVPTFTGPTGWMYKQGITKDTANVNRTNDTIAEYVKFTVPPVALKAVSTLKDTRVQLGIGPSRSTNGLCHQ